MLSALVRTPLDCRCQRSRRMMSSKNSSLTAVLRNEFLDMRLVGDRERRRFMIDVNVLLLELNKLV